MIKPRNNELEGFLAEIYWRQHFELRRPVVPPPLVHKFIDQECGNDAGTGTHDNPFKNPYPKTTQSKPGEAWHIKGRGRPDDATIFPLADGTETDWITYTDWDGAPVEIPGPNGATPPIFLDGRKRICVENLYVNAQNSTTMDGSAIRGNGLGTQHIVIRKVKVEVRPGATAALFYIDPSDIWLEEVDFDGHGRDDPRQANAGDGVAFGGNNVANRCVVYRSRIVDFGHMGIQALTQVSNKHNSKIASGFNYVSSTLGGGITYLRTDDSLEVGNLFDGIATNPDSMSNSKEAIIVNGYRNRYYYNKIRKVSGPAVLFLMSDFGGIGQSCVANDVAGNAIYDCPTYPLAVTLRASSPDLGSLILDQNLYRNNLHSLVMTNGTGGLWEGRTWNIWVTIGAAGFYIPNTELQRWCPGGVQNLAARKLAGIAIRRNIFDPVGTNPQAGFLMYNASDQNLANSNTTYLTSADAEAQFGTSQIERNLDGEAGYSNIDPTSPDFLKIRADSLAIDLGEIINQQPFSGAGTDSGCYEISGSSPPPDASSGTLELTLDGKKVTVQVNLLNVS